MNDGLLKKEKFEKYYIDRDSKVYRSLLSQGILIYEGDSFNKILDIGAGYGNFLSSIEPFNFESLGLEGTEEGVFFCKDKGLNVSKFILQKSNALPFNDNEFSLVIFNQVLEHLDKETGEYILNEIIRILEFGGVAIINSPSKYNRIWNTDPNHVYCWKPQELATFISKFKSVKYNLKNAPIEPWMFFKYSDKIIDNWHKNPKHPLLKKTFFILGFLLNKFLIKFNIYFMTSTANIEIVKVKK